VVEVNPGASRDVGGGTMANYKVTAKELSNLVRLTFDNTVVSDVEECVLPAYEKKYGGVDGLIKALVVEKDKGTKQKDWVDRKNFFGENKVEMEPQVWHARNPPSSRAVPAKGPRKGPRGAPFRSGVGIHHPSVLHSALCL